MPPIYINGQEVVKRYVGIEEVVAAYVGAQQVFSSGPTLLTIQAMFGSGEKGWIYDFTDKSSLFKNSNGTAPVVSDNDPIGYATDLSGNGKHATQPTAGSRPLYVAGSGAVADGTKSLSSGTVDMSAVAQMTVILCVQTSLSSNQGIFEHGTFGAGHAHVIMNGAAGGFYESTLYGATNSPSTVNNRGNPGAAFKVLSAVFDRSKTIATEEVITRVNGEAYGNTLNAAGASGTANFSSATSRLMTWYGGTNFNGKLVRAICIGRLLTAEELFNAEFWVGQGGGLSLIPEIPPAGQSYYSMINSYGQSLSSGVSSPATVLSSTTRFNDVMFTSGVHVRANGQDYSSLVPLVESTATESASAEGETIVSGFAELAHENGYANPFIGTVSGFPSLTIAQCQSGQVVYTAFMSAVSNGMRRSREQFKHFKVRAVPWMQGESDGTNVSYAANLNTLRGTLDTDIKAVTRQTEDVLLLSYQLDRPKIGLAHLAASDTYSNIKVAMPMYFLPHVDGVHLTSQSYKIAGAYFGKAYKEVIVDGNAAWQPLRPISHSTAGANCDLTLNPVGSLAFDTTTVTAQTNYGFKLYQSDGTTPITISSVSLLDADTVRITASGSIPAGAILRYGFSDPEDHTENVSKGNLRDSQGSTLVFDGGGLNYPLHNWCVLFQRVIS